MKIEYESGNFEGAGEASAYIIIRNIFRLEQRHWCDFPEIGIYKQIPLDYLLKRDIFEALRSDFKKGSIDILVINRDHEVIAIRVQGKKGDLKMQREYLQKSLLEDALVKVIDVHKRECKELFKERVNEKSEQEIRDSFKTAKVEMPN